MADPVFRFRIPVPGNGVLIKDAGKMGFFLFLAVIQHGESLECKEQGRPVFPQPVAPAACHGTGLVVVFQVPELDVIRRKDGILTDEGFCPLADGSLVFHHQQLVGEGIIVVEHIKCCITQGRFAFPHSALVTAELDEGQVTAFSQPEHIRIHRFAGFPGLFPESSRHAAGHITAESIHDGRKLFQGLDLIIPETGLTVVEVDDVAPVFHQRASLSLCIGEKPLRMLLNQDRIRRCVIVDDIHDDFHAQFMGFVGQGLQVFPGSLIRVDGPIVLNGVGTAVCSLAVLQSRGLHGQEPENVGTEIPDAFQVSFDFFQGSFL